MVLLPLGVAAQNMEIKNLLKKYSGRTGFSTLSLKDDFIDMADGMELDLPDTVDISNLMDGISSIVIVNTRQPSVQFTHDVNTLTSRLYNYTTLFEVSKDGQHMRALLGDVSRSRQKELVLVVLSAEDNVLVSIVGNYRIKKVTKE
jgi:hypothetical protein